jgi:alpha-beta hydrolase superfamily lysophospholipase
MIPEIKKIKVEKDIELKATIVENGSPIWIVATHGLGEHSGRHDYLDKNFSQYFNICRYDLRGHGESSGEKGNIAKFSDFVNDLESVIKYLKDEYKMDRYYLFAHSMGSLVTSSFLQKRVSEKLYPEKVFLSGPPVAGPGILGRMFEKAPYKFTHSLSCISSSIALAGMLDITKLSHDIRVYDNYLRDPLNSLKIHTKLFFNILAEAKDVFSRPLRVTCPLFVAVATADKLISPDSAIEYFSNVESQAHLLKIEGGYHELHNEVEKYRKPYMDFLKESFRTSS